MFSKIEEIYAHASSASSLIPTRMELEEKLEKWTLNTNSLTEINDSLRELKVAIIKAEGWDFASVDHSLLYHQMVRRIKREQLSVFVRTKLEEFLSEIKTEKDPVQMNEKLLGVLRYVGKTNRNNQTQSNVKTNQVSLNDGVDDLLGLAFAGLPNSSHNNATGTNPNSKSQKNKVRKAKKSNLALTADSGSHSSAADSSDFFKQVAVKNATVDQKGKNDTGNGKSEWVKPWPSNKEYLSKSGNTLSKEVEEWFQGYCAKCGSSRHNFQDCKRYPERVTILTICNKCWSGFHEVCRHPIKSKYGNKNANSKGKVETKAITANPNQMQALAYQGFPMFPMFPNPYQYGGNSDMKGNGSG
jgi:hypothetical protein